MNKNHNAFQKGIVIIIVLLSLVLADFCQRNKKKSGKVPFYLQEEYYNSLKESYCNTNISKRNENYNFGTGYPGVEYYDEMVDAGVSWERMGIFGTDDISQMTQQGLDEIIRFTDVRIMRAQMRGVHTLGEITMSKKCDDLEKLSEVTKKIVERYDGDGVDDMPCLLYPIKYYLVGNGLKVFFEGTEEDYFEILKTIYNAIKNTDMEAKIVHPAIAEGPIPTFWNNLFEMGAADYFDVYNVHEIHTEESIWMIYSQDKYVKEKGIEDKPK